MNPLWQAGRWKLPLLKEAGAAESAACPRLFTVLLSAARSDAVASYAGLFKLCALFIITSVVAPPFALDARGPGG